MDKKIFAAVATLVGTIIGAGFLGIPYVVSKTGIFIGLIYLIGVGLVFLLLKLVYGEIVLRTKGIHQISGYAKKYLGKFGEGLAFFSILFSVYSALIAYMIGEGESFSFLFFGHTQYTLWFGIAFWAFLSFLMHRGIKELKKGESWGLIFTLSLLIIITALFVWKVDVSNFNYSNPGLWFLPFGVVLFAYLGFSAMPEVERILKNEEKKMKKTIIIGSLLPIIFYTVFTLIIVGVNGLNTPQVATLSLGKIFIFLGIITMFTSFLALGFALEDMFRFDCNMKKRKAWAFTTIIPLFLFIFIQLLDLMSFTKVLGIGGSIAGSLMGILILFMYLEAKKRGNRQPEYEIKLPRLIIMFLILLFFLSVASLFL